MGVLITVSTVLFLILAILLIILILLQSDKSAGMGFLGGSSQTAFGSSTADVITKTTGVMIALFMLGSLGLSMFESYRAKSIENEFIFSEEKGKSEVVSEQKKNTEKPAEENKDKEK